MRTPLPAGLLWCLNTLQGAPETGRCPRGLAGAGALVHLQEQEPPRWGALGSTWGCGHSDSSPGLLRPWVEAPGRVGAVFTLIGASSLPRTCCQGFGKTWARVHAEGSLASSGPVVGADIGPDMPTKIGLSGPAVEASGGIGQVHANISKDSSKPQGKG